MDERLSPGRLRWACRRGMLELDLLLGGFAENGYDVLSPAEQRTFQRLLDYPDQQLYELCLGQRDAPDQDAARVIAKIRRAAAAQA